jgi:hypothetical protein
LAAAVVLLTSMVPAAPLLAVRRAAVPPKIDGVLDDAAWRDAAHSDVFRQISPLENADPSERTEFWITYDADNIYVAVRCHDSTGAAGVRAFSMQHDQDNGSDDYVRLVFDTFHRQNDGYFFALTAAGGLHEGLIQNKDEPNYQWDGLWLGKVSRDAGGWSAEFAIPVKTLAFDPANDTWGFNIARSVRRKQEFERWSGFSRAKSVFSLPDLGDMRGLRDLRQGRGIDVKPYVSVSRHSDPGPGEKQDELNPGLDVVWHVTPSLAATLTVNTDFADAEVDERRVNLGRFSLFFPEKRAFFTQDASLFTFAGIQQDPLPFFSRRIGLASDGHKVDLLGGGKLTGRAGPWTIGVLDVQTGSYGDVASQNLFVGRVSRQVLAESSVGLIATHGDPSGAGRNSLLGADFNFVDSHLEQGRSLSVRSGIQVTDSERAGGKGTASTITVNYPNEPLAFQYWFSAVDKKYDPALGFVSRTGVTDLHTVHSYNIYFQSKLVRMIQPFIETDHVTDLHARLLDDGTWAGLYGENPAGDWVNVWAGHSRETYDQPFEISRGVIVPVGVHRWDYFQVQGTTTRSRPYNASVRWRHGGFLTGRTNDYDVTLGARLSSRVELSVSGLLRDIHLPQGSFPVQVASSRIVYSFSPDLQLSLIGQYDNFSSALGGNFRLKWIMQPGNEFFLIVNQGYDAERDHLRPTHNETTLKGSWTIRF